MELVSFFPFLIFCVYLCFDVFRGEMRLRSATKCARNASRDVQSVCKGLAHNVVDRSACW